MRYGCPECGHTGPHERAPFGMEWRVCGACGGFFDTAQAVPVPDEPVGPRGRPGRPAGSPPADAAGSGEL